MVLGLGQVNMWHRHRHRPQAAGMRMRVFLDATRKPGSRRQGPVGDISVIAIPSVQFSRIAV